MTDQNYSSPAGATPNPHIPDPREPRSAADEQAFSKMQEALKVAQEASAKLAQATQEASSALESYSAETQDTLEQRAKALLAAIDEEEAKKKKAVTTETSSQTGQIYFTTTISNIEPPKQVAAAPVVPTTSMPETQQMAAATRPDDSGLDVGVATPGYTDAAQFSRSGFFTEGTTTSLEAARDFSSLEKPKRITPRAPYLVYITLGAIGAMIAAWLVFTIPEAKAIEASHLFLPLVGAATIFFLVGLLMWLPVWVVSRGRTTNHKGLFTRAFLRAALCTTLVTFLWLEALVISDMFRLGQLSL